MTSVLTMWSHPFPRPFGFPSTAGGISAPVPVNDAQRYLRIDFGAGTSAEPSVYATGDPFGIVGADSPFGFNSSWLSTDFDAFFTGRAGVKALNADGTALSMSGSYDGFGDTNF